MSHASSSTWPALMFRWAPLLLSMFVALTGCGPSGPVGLGVPVGTLPQPASLYAPGTELSFEFEGDEGATGFTLAYLDDERLQVRGNGADRVVTFQQNDIREGVSMIQWENHLTIVNMELAHAWDLKRAEGTAVRKSGSVTVTRGAPLTPRTQTFDNRIAGAELSLRLDEFWLQFWPRALITQDHVIAKFDEHLEQEQHRYQRADLAEGLMMISFVREGALYALVLDLFTDKAYAAQLERTEGDLAEGRFLIRNR